MFLENISIQNFRNITSACTGFTRPFTLVTGENAQGKTNFLEAVHFLLSAQSFADSTTEDLLQFEKPGFTVKGTVIKGNNRYDAVLSFFDRVKRVMVNAKAVNTMSEYRRFFPCIASSSRQTEEFLRGPAWRRRMLDRLISQVSSGYTALMKDYCRSLKNRNILLKDMACDPGLLEQYTRRLVSLCGNITRERMQYLADFKTTYEKLFKGLFSVLVPELKPVLTLDGMILRESPGYEENFISLSRKNNRLDRRYGYTTWGLSRSDFLFYLDRRPVLGYASRGQQKLIIMLLMLVQSEIIRALESASPILIIDDMFGEMGDRFINALLEYLRAFDQVFISNIHSNLGPGDNDMITMKNGNPIKGVI